jgi:pSer/pThr/pTyr-binding forkhead associated (FHA) protein
MTQVKSRMAELYHLEIWRNNIRQSIIPVFQREIVVGRGSKTKPVDVPLAGDVEISRRHLTLITDGAGNFWAVNEGKNAAEINDTELPSGQRVRVQPGDPIDMCSYTLCILTTNS